MLHWSFARMRHRRSSAPCGLVFSEDRDRVQASERPSAGDSGTAAQPAKWISSLIDLRASGAQKLYGSLMNRLAIPRQLRRSTVALALSVAMIWGTAPSPIFAAADS